MSSSRPRLARSAPVASHDVVVSSHPTRHEAQPDLDRGLSFEVGSDVGGTFTDLWVRGSDGTTKVLKSPTTGDIVGGVINALHLAAEAYGLEPREFCRRVRRFGHGTTVGLNALLTGRAGRTAVITTQGFADTLEIGRMKRQFTGLNETEVSDYLKRNRIAAIVPRRLVKEVVERIDRTGSVLTPLDVTDAAEVVALLVQDDIEAVAICTLWATENASHELRLRELVLDAAPSLSVSVSHEIAPSVGEYARMSTTAANAALKPVTSGYATRLQDALSELGLGVPVLMMTGTGGVVPAPYLAELPVTALLSGPAAGVVACQELGRLMGRDRILTTDIGGTSFDVGLIVDGAPLMAAEFSFGGVDMRVPCIDVRSIGAGGGSIASVRFGELSVGPQSAGAEPGPACYGRGGSLPTGTDADLVLGVLAADDFVAGGLSLDPDAAERAILEHVADPLGLDLVEAAWGIRQVLDSRMADLLRQVTVERGHDPRTFTFFANGGSGPSHGWVLSRELGMSEFVIPATATVQSAFGSGTSDIKVTSERAIHLRLPSDGHLAETQVLELKRAFAATTDAAVNAELGDTAAAAPTLLHTVALRYRGQSHHLDIPIGPDLLSPSGFRDVIVRFELEYEKLFGRGAGFRPAGFEVLGTRAVATRALLRNVGAPNGQQFTRIGTRDVWFDDPSAPTRTAVYRVEFPASGQTLTGPCLIKYPGQTAVVPPGSTADTDVLGNLIVRSS
jgi:N-methylhydantoinase A